VAQFVLNLVFLSRLSEACVSAFEFVSYFVLRAFYRHALPLERRKLFFKHEIP